MSRDGPGPLDPTGRFLGLGPDCGHRRKNPSETPRHFPLEIEWILARLHRSLQWEPDRPEQLVATEPVHVDARPLDDALEQLQFVHEKVANPILYGILDRVRVEVN